MSEKQGEALSERELQHYEYLLGEYQKHLAYGGAKCGLTWVEYLATTAVPKLIAAFRQQTEEEKRGAA